MDIPRCIKYRDGGYRLHLKHSIWLENSDTISVSGKFKHVGHKVEVAEIKFTNEFFFYHLLSNKTVDRN